MTKKPAPAFPEPASVMRQTDERTGQSYLQGVETADADRANVFGDAFFTRHRRGLGSGLLFAEVEVRYRFFEGTVEDYAEVHSFWVRLWRDTPDGPQAEIIVNGQDFCADHEEEWGEWAELLRTAAERIRNARYNKREFEPRLVGAPGTI